MRIYGYLYYIKSPKQVSERAMKRFKLVPVADKTVEGYSGGMKRKLSTAVALLGDPKVLLMVCPCFPA